jgi:hypothetical protein
MSILKRELYIIQSTLSSYLLWEVTIAELHTHDKSCSFVQWSRISFHLNLEEKLEITPYFKSEIDLNL